MIVGITGLIGSGKDTVADYLIRFHGFRKLSYAKPLKDAVAAVFGWDREMLEGTTLSSREWREQVDEWWANRLDIPHLTPRWVLQHWGTEVCRKNFHNDIWVASIENILRKIEDNVVITDCRFPNEVEAIKKSGGKVIRVVRGELPPWYQYAEDYNLTQDPQSFAKLLDYKVHASEYSSIGLKYDHVLSNNSSIDDLHTLIESVIDL